MPLDLPSCKISLIITAWKEPETIAQALECYATEHHRITEVIIVCPDIPTKEAAEQYKEYFDAWQWIQDPQKGKPHALNAGIEAASHELVVCTDGDVIPEAGAVEQLYHAFLQQPHCGAISGHPVSASPRTTMLGYWSHFLVDSAHQMRLERSIRDQFIFASGYLFIAKKELLPLVPENILSDDAYISNILYARGAHIGYAPAALVYVKFPTTYHDWILQKRRSAGGFLQIKDRTPPKNEMRSFTKEVTYGVTQCLTYPETLKEAWWTLLLIGARLHLWSCLWWDHYIAKPTHTKLWQRVESTK